MKKLAIVTTHPIQYNAPLFKLLSRRGVINIKVFYTWSQAEKGVKYDPGFGRDIEWDIPLLDGYNFTFIENTSSNPGTHHYFGIINPSLNQEISNWEPDALWIFGWNFSSHLKCLRYFHNKIPVLFRGDSTLLAEKWGLRRIFRTVFLKWVYKHIDYALYVGTNNKLYFLRHGVKEEKLVFAPHAIDNSRFIDIDGYYATQALEWREKLNISKQDIVFLYAGKLEYKKNPTLLIKAFKKIQAPNHHLIILGNGPLEKKLKSRNYNSLNIHFIDFQNQTKMPVVYRLCDVFILPSKGPIETWGLSINEAMACSRPVIVSNRCGCGVDLVKEDINGYIFQKNNVKDLSDKMSKMIASKDHLQEMGNNSFSIIKEWSFEKICYPIEKIVSGLIK